MHTAFLQSMQDALQLVKSGQVLQATAAIQMALNGNQPIVPNKPLDPHVIEGEVIKPNTPKASTEPLAAFQTWLDKFQVPLAETKTANHSPLEIPKGAQFLAKTYHNAQGLRDYKLYVPSQYQGQAMPLVVMLHGCTQSADDFAAGTQMNALAEEFGVLVAYPNQTNSANLKRCWNWFNPQDQQANQGEPALIAGITQAVMHDYAVDKRRVYIAGLSAGGAMAAIMAQVYPELYAAVGVHSGLAAGSAHDLMSALNAMRSGSRSALTPKPTQRFVPTIVFHGDQDQTVNQVNAEQVLSQAKATLQASNDEYFNVDKQQITPPQGRSYTRTQFKDAQQHTQIEYWLIQGAGHAWAGGSPAGSYTDPQAPNASREMLRFFLEHPQHKP